MIPIDVSLVNIKDYLRSRNIPFWTEGKNVKDGWVNIQCPFCDDRSNHLGISPTGGINCWRCPTTGTIIKLVMKLEGVNLPIAVERLRNFLGVPDAVERLQNFKTYQNIDKNFEGVLPMNKAPRTQNFKSVNDIFSAEKISHELYPAYADYLTSRKFDPYYLQTKYKLHSGGSIGKYKNRIIIPFFLHGKMITFTSRDITNRSSVPYLHLPEIEVGTSPKLEIYNIDSCKDTIIVVEGPIDVWRIGDGCGATSGIKFTHKQVLILSQFKRVFILYDAEEEAQTQALRLANNLSMKVPHVENISLSEGDPGELNEEDVKHLRKEIFGK